MLRRRLWRPVLQLRASQDGWKLRSIVRPYLKGSFSDLSCWMLSLGWLLTLGCATISRPISLRRRAYGPMSSV